MLFAEQLPTALANVAMINAKFVIAFPTGLEGRVAAVVRNAVEASALSAPPGDASLELPFVHDVTPGTGPSGPLPKGSFADVQV